MNKKQIKKTVILSVLFFLPVIFLLFLYPSTHNYNTLDVVKEDVIELNAFLTNNNEAVNLEGNLTVISFIGNQPLEKMTAILNLKELIYDKFKGFKKFQMVSIIPYGAEAQVAEMKKELMKYDVLDYWKFVYGDNKAITNLHYSLLSKYDLDYNLSTEEVYIVDKTRSQRGRLDDRTDAEIEKNKPVYGLQSYNCIEVAEIKNKMSEDLRILFTEYRQKRKGNFDSSTRRADDIKANEKN